jgi:hypothetical protein
LSAKPVLTLKNKIKLRLSNDNRSVANCLIQFPLQKVLSFCSIFTGLFGSCIAERIQPAVQLLEEHCGLIFTDLLPPQDLRQALYAAGEMPAIGTEGQVEQFRGSLLSGCGMQVGGLQGLEQFLIPGVDPQSLGRLSYFGL